jgi:hypothetical protein
MHGDDLLFVFPFVITHFINSIVGKGKFFYKCGDVYDGQYVSGRKEGQGQFQMFNGDSYIGEWKEDLMHGKGVLKYVSGDSYEGNFHHGKYHGFGIFTYKNNDVYSGEFEMGQINGKGLLLLFYSNLLSKLLLFIIYQISSMQISTSENKKYNHRLLVTAVGDRIEILEGKLMSDAETARGRKSFANGDFFTGLFQKTFMLKGVYETKEGDIFEGDFEENSFRKGWMRFRNFDLYEGSFSQGKMHGRNGKYTSYSTGETFIGDFDRGERVLPS